ncbi:MAG: hypothetical protein ABIQ81_08515 [Novosphingobium sp.]
MKTFTKAVAGTVAASAMALSALSPAMAQDRRHNNNNNNGVSAGEVIAGALIVGGIAAIVSQNNNNRPGFAAVNPRQAVDQCVRAAERGASRMRGDVTDVRSVRQTRSGYEVRGRIAVKTFAGNNWRGKGQYGNGWGNDFRGLNSNLRGYDAGNFVCSFERGRTSVNYNGIRGL